MTMLAREVMQRDVLVVPADTSFRELLHLLVQSGCSGAPVVDVHGKVVGVVSAMDLLRATDQAYDDDVDPGEAEDLDAPALTALELATPDPVWVAPDASTELIARVMRDHLIHRVLVGRDGKLEGIISTLDMLAAVR